MKIIDAHFHLFPSRPDTDADVRAVGHENSADHLLACHRELGVIHGVVMGNGSIGPEAHRYPPQFSYCVGLDSQFLRSHDIREALPQVEEHLGRSSCVGVKLYPGYNAVYVSDPMYAPVYALARKYRKPVAVHMGMTAMSGARLKYSHPLTLDEVAADWPDVQFVMCHFGNPFLEAAAAVLEKNPNVCADLSGLLEGRADLDRYFVERAGYVGLLRTWMDYLGCWDRFLYGTDWPIVNLAEYRDYVTRIVPEERRPAVFFDNANRVYGLGL